jgi:hypothetical protein
VSSASRLHDKVNELQVALTASNYADLKLAPILRDIADCLALVSQAINELSVPPRYSREMQEEMRKLIDAARLAVADLQAAVPPPSEKRT